MKLAVIGKKLSHSFSPQIWHEIFKLNNINGSYELLEINDINNIRAIIKREVLNGCNVTIPYKQTIIPQLDYISCEAKEVGAINSIIVKDNKLYGYNTDVFGYKEMYLEAIDKSHLTNNNAQQVIILGNGGAAKSVAYVHRKMKHDVTIVSRKAENHTKIIAYEDITSLENYDIIVNTTPLGMYPNNNSKPNLPYHTIKKNSIALDLVYNPEETLFINLCRTNGAITLGGMSMLKKQAESFYQLIQNSL